ncbi:MAG TPA: DUF5320 domain-containing protein [Candidatus Omnitrophota bacterium]|nr:DUF5320 domain-containing protein [Candidatus Omnitrophota bacterium]
MPGGDGTGPAGMGPMTGGGRGFCATGSSPREFWGFGRGLQRGGGGRGRRNWFHATGLARWQRGGWFRAFGGRTDQLAAMKEEAGVLEGQLKDLRDRINELEKTKSV